MQLRGPIGTATPMTAATAAGRAINGGGKRGVRIFFASAEDFAYFMLTSIVLGVPVLFFLTMAPFWDWIGSLPAIRWLDHLIAPTIENLTFDYRSAQLPRFPIKRFLVAATTILLCLYFANFIALFSHRLRKRAMLVWLAFAPERLLTYLMVSGGVFCGIWFSFFYDPAVLGFLITSRAGGRLVLYATLTMPLVTMIFGRLSVVILAGAWRSGRRVMKRLNQRLGRQARV